MRAARHIRRLGVVVALVAVLPLSACSSDPLEPADVDLSCPVAAGGPVTLVVGARANSPRPVLPRPIVDLVREAAKASEKIQIVRIDGAPSVAFSGVFRSTAENNTAVARELDVFLDRVLTSVAALTSKSAEADVLFAVNEAARLTDGGGTIVLIDSGLQTAGQIRFQDPGMFDADPGEVTTFLHERGQLPDLTGRSVVLLGLGNTADPQPAISDPSVRTKLTELWVSIAQAAQAACVLTVETSAPQASVAAGFQVTVVSPPTTEPFGPCGTRVLRDGGTVGFLPDLATFRDPEAARKELQTLAAVVAQGRQRIELIGTTSSAGSSEPSRKRLSRQRAQAVKTALVQLGVAGDRITTTGGGSTSRYHIDDRGPNGELLPGPAATNRSVVVVLTC